MGGRLEYDQRKDITSLMFLKLNLLVVKCIFFFYLAREGPVLNVLHKSSVLLSHGVHSTANLM